MNFGREAWRPLYLREPVWQHRWNLVTRGLRVYLIRAAEDDGTLLKLCANPYELVDGLSAHPEEIALVRKAIDTLLHDGFLRWEGTAEEPGWLGIDRLVTFAPARPREPESADEDDEAPAAAPAAETPGERRRRLARERKQRSRGGRLGASRGAGARDIERDIAPSERDRERDFNSVTSVTGERDQRDQRDLPPHTPLSDKQDTIGNESVSGARARGRRRDIQRDRERDTPSVTSVTGERDQRDAPSRAALLGVIWVDPATVEACTVAVHGVVRWTSVPCDEPPQEYLAQASLAGVGAAQARSTWAHYRTAGLPPSGVERLIPWLVQQAKSYLTKHAQAGSRRHGSAQPDAGKTGWEHLEEQHR